MQQYKLYDAKEIERLKRELQIYKQSLEATNSHNPLDHFVRLQRDLHDLKVEFSMFKGEVKNMKEHFKDKTEEFEEQNKNNSSQIQTVSESLNQIKQNVTTNSQDDYKTQVTDLLNKMELVINRTEENMTTLKEHTNTTKERPLKTANYKNERGSKTAPRQISEYRKLHNMLQSHNQVTQQNPNYSSSYNQRLMQSKPLNKHGRAINTSNQNKTAKYNNLEFNKNIITRVSKPENNIMKTESLTEHKNNGHSQVKDSLSQDNRINNREPKQDRDIEHSHEKVTPTNQQNNKMPMIDDSYHEASDENNKMMQDTKSDCNDEPKSRLRRKNNKKNLSSLWAFFIEKLR
ncbi:hypothetical protein ABID56_001844 [Alkalibacillus flavidus]|uniref:Uncharacterized protein n=1 Tax=Alkalibacillus flavidus TaxID=546021 RepID=A0ABV2KVX1_9BACI